MARRRNLTLDSLEPRNLLSIAPLINSPGWTQTLAPATLTKAAASTIPTAGATASSQLVLDPTTGLYYNPNLGGSGITTDAAPARPNELKRQVFKATFSGKVIQEAPRLIDQSRQYYILAPGTSTSFLHGTAQLRIYTPNPRTITFTDPNTGQTVTETPTATTGTISMSDRSTQSGSVILANLTGSPTNVDKLGRPTLFNLSLNGGGGSGGIYASSVGTGTVSITYRGNNATIKVHAFIFTSGIGNPLDIYQGVNL